MGRAPQAPQVPAANWGDLGLLAQPGGLNNPTVDYGELDRLGQPQQARQEEELNWGILGEGGGSSGGGGAAAPHDDDDDDIPIFDGFQDNKPVLGGGGGGGGRSGANTGEGLSWDAERGLWKESKPRSAFSGMSSSWDLRSAGSAFKSPTSLLRLRSQAEKVFDDAVGSSLFTSPSMQRFKKQTDDMFATLSSFVPVSTTNVLQSTRSFFSSWFS